MAASLATSAKVYYIDKKFTDGKPTCQLGAFKQKTFAGVVDPERPIRNKDVLGLRASAQIQEHAMEYGATRQNSATGARRKAALPTTRNRKSRADDPNDARPFSVSERLRQLRTDRNLSLEQVARKAGLTKGFLSLIERGVKAPSISSLLRLSQVYDLSIGALLDDSRPGEPTHSLVRRDERKKFAREGSLYGYRYEALAFRKKRKRMEPFIVSPPLRVPRRFFEHEGDEMVYVLSGQIEIHLGSEKIRLTPGDCIYFDAKTPHRSRSIGRERAQTLVVVDPNSLDR